MNSEYKYLVKDILDNNEFSKLEIERHHGTNRLIHSKRVSHYSYRICKILGIDYVAAARGGLLHDFFIYEKEITKKDRFKLIFTHPQQALRNAEKYYELSDKEKNIIVSHMFPANINLPKYLESWIISTVDKIVAIYEFVESFSMKNAAVPNLYLLLLTRIFN